MDFADAQTVLATAGVQFAPGLTADEFVRVERQFGFRFPPDSVYQTDIIYYGADLMDYFHNEFTYHFGRAGYTVAKTPRHIEFWSRLAEENDESGGRLTKR